MIVIDVDIFNFHVFVCTRVYLFICCNLAPPPKIQKKLFKNAISIEKNSYSFLHWTNTLA